MAVNWGLATDFAGPLDILRAAGDLQMQKLQVQRAQRSADIEDANFARQQRLDAARQSVGAQVAQGDLSGARTAALSGGDFELANQIAGLSKEQREEAGRHAQIVASTLYDVGKLPAEQRAAAWQSALPALKSQGLDDEDLVVGNDLSDNGIQGAIGSVQTLASKIDQHNKDVDAGLKRDQFGETVRNHDIEHQDRQTGFGLQRRGQDLGHADAAAGRAVTLHGQALADARAHEANRIAAANGKPLTEAQGKATTYYMRAKQSESDLNAVGNVPPPGAGAQFADGLPLGVGSHFIADKDQQQLTARRGFIAAVLRQESGAAISNSEFNSYNKLYFPQQGDKPQVIANKARLRRQAVDGLKLEAGPGGDKADALPSMQGGGGAIQVAPGVTIKRVR